MVKNQVSLTFYGGVNEIGETKFYSKPATPRVLFGFGMSFKAKNQFLLDAFL